MKCIVSVIANAGCSVGYRGPYSDMSLPPQRFCSPFPSTYHNRPAYQVCVENFLDAQVNVPLKIFELSFLSMMDL